MVALVTGANRGIGLEVCRQLGALGHHIIVTARDRQKADRAAKELRTSGIEAAAEALDVADASGITRLAQALTSKIGRVDILVNNAAILVGEDDSVLDIPIDDFRTTLGTNVLGAIAVSQAFVPGMVERGFGRVVNVSSGAGQLSTMSTYAPAYSISKAALNAFTRTLAAATQGSDVLVNSADPGWVRTDMGGPNAPRSVEQGADTIVWLATLPAGGPTGKFFSNRREMPW